MWMAPNIMKYTKGCFLIFHGNFVPTMHTAPAQYGWQDKIKILGKMDIWSILITTRKPASRVFLAPPEGLMTFLSSLYHA